RRKTARRLQSVPARFWGRSRCLPRPSGRRRRRRWSQGVSCAFRGRFSSECWIVFRTRRTNCARLWQDEWIKPPAKSSMYAPSPTRATRSDCGVLELQRRRYRHGDGRSRPTAQVLHHLYVGEPIGEGWRNPDMIEPAAFVGSLPVSRAVAPPRVKLGRLRNEHAHGVDPAALLLCRDELLALDRRVRPSS